MAVRVHIIGSGPRSGTTLLAEAMKICFEFDSTSEHEASIAVSNSKLGGGDFILSKYPVEIDLLKWPIKLNPNLYVICIVRDPRDVAVSNHGAYPDIYWASFKFWKLFLKYYEQFINHSRFNIIKYEDLVTHPNRIQDELQDFIPFFKKKYNFSEYHNHANPSKSSIKALKKVRPISPKGIGNWKLDLPRIKQQIKLHGNITNSLVRFGYENNDDWLDKLNDLPFENFETKTGEFFKKNELERRKSRILIACANMLLENIGMDPEKVLNPIKKFFRKPRKS